MMGVGYKGKKAMTNDDDYSNWFYRRCAGWKLKFALWPRRCDLTNNLIWLKHGYQGMAILTGPGEDIVEWRWHDKDEHLMWKIKGN